MRQDIEQDAQETRKPVDRYELIDHGIEGSQYFQGCGVCLTDFDYVATGIGENFAEALDDCLESIAQGEENADTEDLERRIREDEGYTDKLWPTEPSVTKVCERANQDQKDEETGEYLQEFYDGIDSYYYVSIRYSMPAAESNESTEVKG